MNQQEHLQALRDGRIIVVNDDLYIITEKDYKKIIKFMLSGATREQLDKQHIENCEYIKNKYEPTMHIHLILRDD
jgi:predicted RecB family endonuclease